MTRNRGSAKARPALGAALAAAVMTATAAAAAACSSANSPASTTTTPSTPGTPGTPGGGRTTSVDPVADCASQIDYWITTSYLRGEPDRGDYQEMGLGSSEGLALRQLEQHLGQTVKTFPAPAPANLRQQELAACDAAGAAATATGTKPPVWP